MRESKLFSLNDVLIVYFSVNLDTGELVFHKFSDAAQAGWFDDLLDDIGSFVDASSECLGDLWTPLDHFVFDTGFVAAATTVTGGWFVPATVAACGIKVGFFN